MTIEKHQVWGRPGPLPAGAPVVDDDRDLRAVVEEARRRGAAPPTVGLLGGDLCRTVGGRGDRDRLVGPEAVTLPLDLASVVVDDDRQLWFASHLVARRSWWRGEVLAVMNAQWIGRWDVAPRSHPNDGLLDVLRGDPSLDDRLKARRRLLTGTHVPHPAITQQRVPRLEVAFDRPTPVWLDGRRATTARRLVVVVEPDAYACVV